MAKNFMAPPGGPQVTTFQRPRPSKPKITTPPKRSRPSPSPKVVTEQPIPKEFRQPPSAPLDIDNKVYRPPPQVAPQAPYNRPVPPGPMDLPPDRRIRSTPVSPRQLPPRENPVRTTPFAQRPFNPFAPVTPSIPVFPTNPITPNYPDIREREAQRMREFENIAKPIQDPRFMSHRGSLQHLLNRGLSGRVGQYYE